MPAFEKSTFSSSPAHLLSMESTLSYVSSPCPCRSSTRCMSLRLNRPTLARTPVSCRRLCGPTNAWHHLLFIWVISKFIGEVQQMAYNPSLYVKQRSNFVDLFASVLACCASVFRWLIDRVCDRRQLETPDAH